MKSVYLIAMGAVLFACSNPKTNEEMTTNSNTEVPKLSSDIMTPEVLWSFGRIGEPAVSPDQTKVLYAVTTYLSMVVIRVV